MKLLTRFLELNKLIVVYSKQ